MKDFKCQNPNASDIKVIREIKAVRVGSTSNDNNNHHLKTIHNRANYKRAAL